MLKRDGGPPVSGRHLLSTTESLKTTKEEG